jgi:8-oxo-dGTP pyrophosphatase MutT (NUDIX family)
MKSQGTAPTHKMKRKILSAGVIPVRFTPEGPRFLLLRAYNYWDFPKGVVDRDEDPLAAALRELQEETSLTGAELKWGTDFRETPPYAKGKVARYYLAEVQTDTVNMLPNPLTNFVEHQEYRWVSYDDARKLVAERVRLILEWAHEKIQKL